MPYFKTVGTLYYNAPDRETGSVALAGLFASMGISFIETSTAEVVLEPGDNQ
jgi:hypothetical protein